MYRQCFERENDKNKIKYFEREVDYRRYKINVDV